MGYELYTKHSIMQFYELFSCEFHVFENQNFLKLRFRACHDCLRYAGAQIF